ncbi:hypothetical protein [Runella slithyformis]|uniref:Uncharacterized protein n=1 Tax=Runella slithyformis (strain ATCC 29530 / DSM 19594 / LMG 11500 / NCIMB 11436 / LSU 4) TaxID=761193 RepID=A0A7U4E3U4_RUNSL|nr:hypothetical protein [Runella slithyformis]AEI46766.1 hypothetical protein Runsl_0314 [Runella slithyformis DSM 19594]
MILHINLRLYEYEAVSLKGYLIAKLQDITKLNGHAPDADFVLCEWLTNKFGAQVAGIERRGPKTPQKVVIPVSVARILWKNWQQEPIPATLTMVLGGIDAQLKNLNLHPR